MKTLLADYSESHANVTVRKKMCTENLKHRISAWRSTGFAFFTHSNQNHGPPQSLFSQFTPQRGGSHPVRPLDGKNTQATLNNFSHYRVMCK